MRGLEDEIGPVDLTALKPSPHLMPPTKFSTFLLRTCGWTGGIGTDAGFLTSADIPGGCQIANGCASTMVRVGRIGREEGEGCEGKGNDERGYRGQRSEGDDDFRIEPIYIRTETSCKLQNL